MNISSAKLFCALFILVFSVYACSQKKEIIYVNPDDNSLMETFSNLGQLTKKPNVEIVTYDKLTVEFARDIEAKVIIRGLRAVTDYVSEVQMAIMNRSIAPDIETMLMVAEEGYSFVSSSLIKEFEWCLTNSPSFI